MGSSLEGDGLGREGEEDDLEGVIPQGHLEASWQAVYAEEQHVLRGCKFFCVYGGKILPIRFRYVPYSVELLA